MARTCMAVQANALFLRKMRQLRRQFSSFVIESRGQQAPNQKEDETETESLSYNSSTWVPHPRTGIYFPQGHEWVMKDIPENAASFSQLCWFRDSDGIDDLNLDNDNSPRPRFATVFSGRD
ncbi:uncharacterized protein LOC120077680 [Benincasa hispida]|uniref:uncharacterized protein LOC120077680 n=1 Tax=Benincasa hispida TaxID=102211 RepID=UPI0018FFD7DE|nr:uncharacterized protein LOC120077680 [Benincasa hispida]